MDLNHKGWCLSGLLFALPLTFASSLYAAEAIDLSQKKPVYLSKIIGSGVAPAARGVGINETSRNVDLNKTLHVRIQQTYYGVPVFGGDGVVHIPNGEHVGPNLNDVIAAGENGSMNGLLYLSLDKDIAKLPNFMASKDNARKALNQAIQNFQKKGSKTNIVGQKTELIVYMDDQNKGHWAYQISFEAQPVRDGQMPAKPVYIIDALTLETYAEWDEIKTASRIIEKGGGFGGNLKMGKVSYDGLKDHLRSLKIDRNETTMVCAMKNKSVTVEHYRSNEVPTFNCAKVDADHNNIYWNGEFDAVNGGYSPDNDALFGGIIIKNMYLKWYGVPVLTENGKPMMLTMVVHSPIDNAYWDGRKMTFGDGVSMFYPLTSLGVAAHEISHGFTQQHSNLAYYGQSGGMNESYSDMAAQAAEVFAYGKGKNSWQIGPEIFKAPNEALRYMDQPSKDCNGKQPGNWCSIDDASQYYNGLDVHFSSGVYNRFFYILGTTKGWDAKKAFDVMVQANMNYWTSRSTFVEGACGSLKAAKDLGYNVQDVINAFDKVKVSTTSC